MERINAAATFTDSLTADLGGPRTSALLDQLDAAVPWEQLARPVRTLYRNGVQKDRDRYAFGRPPEVNMKHPQRTNMPNGATIMPDGRAFCSPGAPNMILHAHNIASDPCMMTDRLTNLSNGVNKRTSEHAV